MTHSWSLGEFEVAPGLVIHQYLSGGPVDDPDTGKMKLTESVSWTLRNYDLADRIRQDNCGFYKPWLYELSITETQAIAILRASGHEIKSGKAGLCRIDTPLVKKPETKSWEICEDFFPEGYADLVK